MQWKFRQKAGWIPRARLLHRQTLGGRLDLCLAEDERRPESSLFSASCVFNKTSSCSNSFSFSSSFNWRIERKAETPSSMLGAAAPIVRGAGIDSFAPTALTARVKVDSPSFIGRSFRELEIAGSFCFINKGNWYKNTPVIYIYNDINMDDL